VGLNRERSLLSFSEYCLGLPSLRHPKGTGLIGVCGLLVLKPHSAHNQRAPSAVSPE
jgi:hypothetical protein